MKSTKEFEMVECRGTPYEIGLQCGKGCKQNISKAMELTFGGLSFLNNTTKEIIIANTMKLLPNVKEFDPDLIDMLKGQADGASLSFEEVFTLKCGYDLGAYYSKLSGLCTSFAVTGNATRDGKTLLGQNIDWFPGTPMDLLKITYADGSEQLSLVLWGIVEYTLNSNGFGICANGTWAAEEKYLFNIPVGCYISKAMRQNTIEDAMGVLRTNARGIGYYHLASAGGEMVGIESIQDDYQVLLPEKDVLVHSNHYLIERFKEVDMVNDLVPDSPKRFETISRLIDQHYGQITPEIMMEIMADHYNHPYSICRHVDETTPPQFHSETLCSFIMIPENRTMLIAYGNPCKYEYIKYQL